ncbi:unnamed protein product [Enterobius vermicularis]|uniref:GDNF domain-containing protein n=1 Tax=Enterobius vermicularis TaxID=51028 RepID=A0A0N4V755_ENTVE|nr:unnamed protein product [Enterobius vermicularis]
MMKWIYSCNSKWEVYFSECETEALNHDCSKKCRERLNETLSTQQGAVLGTCVCADTEDELCVKLRDAILKPCITVPSKPDDHMDNSVTDKTTPMDVHMDNTSRSQSLSPQLLPIASLCLLLLFRWALTLF